MGVGRASRARVADLLAAGLGEAGGVRQRSALRDTYPLRRTRVSGAESVWRSDATTRPWHHSGPVRGVVPGTTRIRETTALGGKEPIADKGPRSGSTGVTRLPGCRA